MEVKGDKANEKKRVLAKDQTAPQAGSHAKALVAAHANGHPVLVFTERRYALFPYEFRSDAMYCALGWYWIRDIWGARGSVLRFVLIGLLQARRSRRVTRRGRAPTCE